LTAGETPPSPPLIRCIIRRMLLGWHKQAPFLCTGPFTQKQLQCQGSRDRYFTASCQHPAPHFTIRDPPRQVSDYPYELQLVLAR
jgi:hypothetical protein